MDRTQISQEAFKQFNLFKQRQAELHGVDATFISDGHLFSVSPNVEKTWYKNLYAADDLLSKINTGTCKEMICENLGVIVPSGIVSGRTNNADRKNPRKPRKIGGTDGVKYTTATTHFDTYILYRLLNEWATSPEFQQEIQKFYFEKKRDDIRMIGWNGIKVAENSDPDTNELGEDVNIGWLQRTRIHKSEHVFKDKIGTIPLTVGAKGSFKNLDELVAKAIAVIPPALRKDLVVFASDNMLIDREAALYGQSDNKDLAGKLVALARSSVGNKPAYAADFFPEKTIFITSFDNLAHITQTGSIRQRITNNEEFSCVDRFSETEEFYALADYNKAVLLEGIEFKEEE